MFYYFDTIRNVFSGFYPNNFGVVFFFISTVMILMISVLSLFSILDLSKNRFNKVLGFSVISIFIYIISNIPTFIGTKIVYDVAWGDLSPALPIQLKQWFLGGTIPENTIYTIFSYMSLICTILLITNLILSLLLRKNK